MIFIDTNIQACGAERLAQAPPTEFDLTKPEDVLLVLKYWQQTELLRSIDRNFARYLYQAHLDKQTRGETTDDKKLDGRVLLLAALLSKQVGNGHVCLNLQRCLSEPQAYLPIKELRLSQQSKLPLSYFIKLTKTAQASLSELTLSQAKSMLLESEIAIKGEGLRPELSAPLIVKQERLYLQRLHQYENIIISNIRSRLDDSVECQTRSAIEFETLEQALTVLFPFNTALEAGQSRSQKEACKLAAKHHFAVITGGPGTGKTTTVLKLLAALQTMAGVQSYKYRIALAAPTGKAAARLTESISGSLSNLPLSKLPNQVSENDIPTKVSTLDALLGRGFNTRKFRHNQHNRLKVDILVIDEASMVDVDLMAAVMQALPTHARLILLGDRDQLASVDAGAVFGDLASSSKDSSHTLHQNIAVLDHSFRFDADSGIKLLSDEVNKGISNSKVFISFKNGELKDSIWLRDKLALRFSDDGAALHSEHFQAHIKTGSKSLFPNDSPVHGYYSYLKLLSSRTLTINDNKKDIDAFAQQVLDTFDCFRLLTAVKAGPWGVDSINLSAEKALVSPDKRNEFSNWYEGRPVLVTQNDYNLGLMNGDVGMTFRFQASEGSKYKVAFRSSDPDQSIRWFSVNRLQYIQTAFAMTVHKSQGSEFEHACLVLPQTMSAVLTKELLYTAITRAKRYFSLVTSNPDVFHQAASKAIQRDSGLLEDL